MDDHLKVLLLVGGRLDQAGIPYMLSGSIAMNFYARPRMTRDVDLVVELVAADVERVVELFQEDFSVDEQEVREVLAHPALLLEEGNAMNDTLPRAEALVRALLLQRSGEERLKMGADMFSAARALIAASLQEEGLVPGSVEWKLQLLERTYGSEVSPVHRQRLLERWRSMPTAPDYSR